MNRFFNAHHSPVGAFSSFTVGLPGAHGGWGVELEGPARDSIYLGVETRAGGCFEALPFYDASGDDTHRYLTDPVDKVPVQPLLRPFAPEDVERDFRLASDTFRAGDLTWTIYSPVWPLPDPFAEGVEALRDFILPAVVMEVTVDNSAGERPRQAFFGAEFKHPTERLRELYRLRAEGLCGLGKGLQASLVTDAPDAVVQQEFTIERILRVPPAERFHCGLGPVGLICWTVPAGARRTVRFAAGFYRGGVVTTEVPARYLYNRFWNDVEEVSAEALRRFEALRAGAVAHNQRLDESRLSAAQRFQLAHAVHSYYGSTELLEHAGQPFWVVNEGEYRMLNTFDLTVDHLFFELAQNPWAVRNALDWFADRYAYTDEVFLPESPETLHPGGLSFTHDMGVMNGFSPAGHSCYERPYRKGCFSYMTHEQLTNWVLCAAAYTAQTGDTAWRDARATVFRACLDSLVNRDHPDPAQRDGIMGCDSSRTRGWAEITTYDALDESLGQARANAYLAVKTWAAYLALEPILRDHGDAAGAALAGAQAARAAATLLGAVRPDGTLPAVLEGHHAAVIIPVIEGLAFPARTARADALAPDGPYGPFLASLRRHLDAVLAEGRCLFPDGGWKLSSTSDNSWLSKIYLCQHVARTVLGLPWEAAGARADAAHAAWLTDPRNAFFAWSDQCLAGLMVGSKYYPRGVTAWLWLAE